MNNKGNRVTVRDLRTRFPEIERRLLNGEELVVTKRGKIVALLMQPERRPSGLRLNFAKRFGGSVHRSGPNTDVVGMLLKEREGSI
jgi:antitoxin (DNA-binding transcriptional repressor) of toxin-antitoxin stability system